MSLASSNNEHSVAQTASKAEIKAQYYRMAKLYHPDTNPGDPTAHTKFQAVQQAYDILKNAPARRNFDRDTAPYSQRPSTHWPHHQHEDTTTTSSQYTYRRRPAWNSSSREKRFDYEAHQYGHYGSEGARRREERRFAAERVARERSEGAKEGRRIVMSVVFCGATLYLILVSGYVQLLWR
ncbi:MAG: hypothetical protein SGCHY_003695 [Lobulomycetales sp.]